MSYHRLKMDEVNKIIAELWNETYDGSGTPWSVRPSVEGWPGADRESGGLCETMGCRH